MKLSIITPTRNRLEYLKENVASVRLSVTNPSDFEIEHVIFDCASDDGTAEWLQSPEAEGLTVVSGAGPIPPGEARNLAIRASKGELIMPLDDDDLLLQRTAYHFAHALADGIDWSVAGYLKVDSSGRYLPGEDYYAWDFSSPSEMLAAIFSGKHFIQGNVCFRRSLFDAVGGYSDMKTAEDLELYTRFVLHAGLPKCISAVSHLHRVHGNNVSRDIGKNQYNEDMTHIYDMHRIILQEQGIGLVPIP